jgi:hypothetical protein
MLQFKSSLGHHLLQFIASFYPPNLPRSHRSFTDQIMRWFASVETPLSVLLAEFRTITTLPTALHGSWADLEASRVAAPVDVHFIRGVSHFGILGDEECAALLQRLGSGIEVS